MICWAISMIWRNKINFTLPWRNFHLFSKKKLSLTFLVAFFWCFYQTRNNVHISTRMHSIFWWACPTFCWLWKQAQKQHSRNYIELMTSNYGVRWMQLFIREYHMHCTVLSGRRFKKVKPLDTENLLSYVF